MTTAEPQQTDLSDSEGSRYICTGVGSAETRRDLFLVFGYFRARDGRRLLPGDFGSILVEYLKERANLLERWSFLYLLSIPVPANEPDFLQFRKMHVIHLHLDLLPFNTVEGNTVRFLDFLSWIVFQEREEKMATMVVSQHLKYRVGFDRPGCSCHHLR